MRRWLWRWKRLAQPACRSVSPISFASVMNRSLVVIFAIAAVDAAGIALIFPILPNLLRDITGVEQITRLFGQVLALYALMQFVFAPVLGVLSDRYGRRPILLLSLAGSTIDYLIM